MLCQSISFLSYVGLLDVQPNRVTAGGIRALEPNPSEERTRRKSWFCRVYNGVCSQWKASGTQLSFGSARDPRSKWATSFLNIVKKTVNTLIFLILTSFIFVSSLLSLKFFSKSFYIAFVLSIVSKADNSEMFILNLTSPLNFTLIFWQHTQYPGCMSNKSFKLNFKTELWLSSWLPNPLLVFCLISDNNNSVHALGQPQFLYHLCLLSSDKMWYVNPPASRCCCC